MAGLADAETVGRVVALSEVVMAVCPPQAALGVARAVVTALPSDWSGIYLDANAVAPSTMAQMVDLAGTGMVVVDGGIIGPPPSIPGTTRLYLSGTRAGTTAGLWNTPNLEAIVLSDRVGDASALKLAYAAWSKGSQALLVTIRALAEAEGVRDWLEAEWRRSGGELSAATDRGVRAAATKGWRWSGEMEEIAGLLRHRGLPTGFHQAAAEVFARVPRRGPTDPVPDGTALLESLQGKTAALG
jgi:hypothetical protein